MLSWKFIVCQPYVRRIKMKTYNPTNFPSPWENIFLKATEDKFIVWNYHFSGPNTIYLFEFSNTNSRIKCKICSKLTIKALDIVLVSLLFIVKLWWYMTHCSQVFLLALNLNCRWIFYCLNLNLPTHFRVRFRSIVGRGYLNPYFLKTLTLYSLPPPSFSNFFYITHL